MTLSAQDLEVSGQGCGGPATPTADGRHYSARRLPPFHPLFALLILLALAASPLRAQTTWTYGGTGNLTWETAGSWTPASVPDAPGGIVSIFVNAAGTRNVTIGSPHTIASLSAGRGGANNTRMYIFNGAGVLTLDNTGFSGKPFVGQSGSLGYQEYPVVLAGSQGVRFGGGGSQVINGNNTFTGDVEFNRNTTRIGHVNSLPHGARTGNVSFVNSGSGYGTLDLGLSITINGFSSPAGAGTVTTSIASGIQTLTVGDNDQSGNFGGSIVNGSGTVGFGKIGTGTQILSGTVSYSGPTTISGGRLQLAGSTTLSSSSMISIGTGGIFDVTGVASTPYTINAAQTLNGSGATGHIDGSLTLDAGAGLSATYVNGTPSLNIDSGTTTLNGNNATVNVAGGVPLLNGSYKLISKSGGGLLTGTVGSVTIGGVGMAGGGTPYLEILGNELYLNITNGAPGVEWGSGNGTWADNVTGWNSGGTSVYTNGNVALLTDTFSTGNPTLTLNSTVVPQGVVVSSTNHYTISGTGAIDGPADFRKLGSGAVTLDTTNSYTGGSTLFAGTMNFRNSNSLGAASGTFTINGGTLDNTSGSPLTLDNYPQAWNANFTFLGSSSLNLGAGPVTINAARVLTVNAGTLTVGGDISGSFTLGKSGAGTLRLDGNNSFLGTTTISLGEIIVGNDGALNSSSPVAIVFPTDANVKALSLNGHSVTIRNLTMGIISGGTATVVRNTHPTTPVTLTVNCTAAAQFAGTITDGGAAPLALTKTGSATFTLGGGSVGSGTYSGDTVVSQGTLSAGANDIFPHGVGKGDILVAASCTLDTVDRGQITVNGLYGGGTITHSANSTANIFRVGESGSNGDFSGVIQNGAAISPFVSFTKLGAGTQILRGANTYTGPTTNSGGILQIGNGGTGGSLASLSLVNNASLVFNRDGTLNYAGVISGSGTVTNIGPGIVNLTGVSTYSGPTTVSAGTLRVNGTGVLPAATTVTVNGTGTLGGTGKILAPVSVASGGTLAPGASIGTLSISNNLAMAADSTNVFEINLDTLACDSVIGLTSVAFNGTLVLTNVGGTDSATNGATFKLFDAQTYSGAFIATNTLPALAGRAWDLSNLAVNGTVKLVYIGSTTPPTVTNALSGDSLVLTWSLENTGWRLLGQTNSTEVGLSNNWFMVTGSLGTNQMSFTVDPANGAVFYRLTYP